MSINDDALPGHDDIDAGDLAFVQDLIDKQQAIEDAAHRLAKKAALEMLVHEGNYFRIDGCFVVIVNEHQKPYSFSPSDNDVNDSILFLIERCGATYETSTRTLRMPKE